MLGDEARVSEFFFFTRDQIEKTRNRKKIGGGEGGGLELVIFFTINPNLKQ